MIGCVKRWQMPTHSPEDELMYGITRIDCFPRLESLRNSPCRGRRDAGGKNSPASDQLRREVLGRIMPPLYNPRISKTLKSGGCTTVTLLTSWKENANYLGKGVRTLQRWEQESGLPVRRPNGERKGVLRAYSDEIDVWMRSHFARRGPYELDALRQELAALRTQN